MTALKKYKTGEGKFRPDGERLYFLSSTLENSARFFEQGAIKTMLIAMNELTEDNLDLIIHYSDRVDFMLDSGIYAMTQVKVRQGLTQKEAFGLPPSAYKEFGILRKRYTGVMRKLEPYIWGYVELDIGGEENKRKIRAELHDEGLYPIPVYHPYNDSQDYFDELASEYDRICIGGIAHMENDARMELLAHLYSKKDKYQPLWIHLLGVTPSLTTYNLPFSSCDATSWLTGVKYRSAKATAGGYNIGIMPRTWMYREDDSENRWKCVGVWHYFATMKEYEWNTITDDIERIYAD